MPNVYQLIVLILSSLMLCQCTTAIGGTTVLLVSSQSEGEEIRGRRYSITHQCLFKHREDPYIIAEHLIHGRPINHLYQKILNPGLPREAFSTNIAQEDDSIPVHYTAYALYMIAQKLGDKRATPRIKWLNSMVEPDEQEALKEYLNHKYLTNFLRKCFKINQPYYDPATIQHTNKK
tara:strand:- start:134 stop:664 length:531 start_codon:yes stop_codon:yes gene_type:complete